MFKKFSFLYLYLNNIYIIILDDFKIHGKNERTDILIDLLIKFV